MIDLTKLQLHTGYDGFKNNAIYTGTLTISGATVEGTNTRTFTVTLNQTPDLTDIVFNGPTDTIGGNDPRPSTGWFKRGSVWAITDNAGGGNPARWVITSSFSGVTVTITATYSKQFSTAEVMTSTDFSYRIIDYSAF